jgi:tetratricopeptide (TPR) repeat protein
MPPRLALAELGRLRKNYSQTLRYADEILSNQPKLPQARLLRAVGLMGTQNYIEARSELTALGEDLPQYTEVEFQLAALDLAEKKFRDAETRFRRLYGEDKRQIRALAGLAETYAAENRLDEVTSLLTGELKKSPDSDAIRTLLADTAVRKGNYDLALELYQQAAAKNPRSAKLQSSLGAIYRLKGDVTKSIACFQIVKDLSPSDPAASAVLGDALHSAGRIPEAIANYRQALELDPENPSALNNLAFVLADGEQSLDEAQKLAEQAVQRVPQEPHFTDTLGYVFLKRKLDGRAIKIYNDLTAKYPANPVYRYHFGLALLNDGQKARAKTELEMALGKSLPEGVRKNIETTLALMNN